VGIDAHLRTRLLSEAHADQETVLPTFQAIVGPTLERLGIHCELTQTYSAEKRTEVVTINDDRNYLVFDHALSETFNLFNRLTTLRVEGADSFIEAALYRPLAEALREAQKPALYAFFIRGALEAKPFMRVVTASNPSAGNMFWQDLVILFHEAAHALPLNSAERTELSCAANVLASTLANDLILGMTGQLSDLLETDAFGERAKKDMETWSAAKDDLNIGDDAIYETYAAVGTDPRFLDELMCDFFAIHCVTTHLNETRARTDPDIFPDVVVSAFLACHAAFLHMRLLKYLADVAHNLAHHLEQAKLDPLKLRWLVELTFRANIVVKRLLDAADIFGLPDLTPKLAERLASVQDAHTGGLINISNQLLEGTLLSANFHATLPAALEQDGFDMSLLENDPIGFFEAADGFWQVLVA
jgi:hypothetical protein